MWINMISMRFLLFLNILKKLNTIESTNLTMKSNWHKPLRSIRLFSPFSKGVLSKTMFLYCQFCAKISRFSWPYRSHQPSVKSLDHLQQIWQAAFIISIFFFFLFFCCCCCWGFFWGFFLQFSYFYCSPPIFFSRKVIIPNPGVLYSKILDGLKVDSAFHYWEQQVQLIFGECKWPDNLAGEILPWKENCVNYHEISEIVGQKFWVDLTICELYFTILFEVFTEHTSWIIQNRTQDYDI